MERNATLRATSNRLSPVMRVSLLGEYDLEIRGSMMSNAAQSVLDDFWRQKSALDGAAVARGKRRAMPWKANIHAGFPSL
jgi:hypothetical protein